VRYKQLTYEERYTLMSLKKAGFSNNKSASLLNRSRSTIGRELKRNLGLCSYSAKQAHDFCVERRKIPRRPEKWSEQIETIVIQKLTDKKWSPEQISDNLKCAGLGISHERIYQYIYKNRMLGGKLYKNLRRAGKKYKKRNVSGRTKIKNRVGIEERPHVVALKERIGDWEGDTIIGKGHKSSLVTIVERKSKFLLIRKPANNTATELAKVMVDSFKLCKDLFKTLTVDNGSEFSRHERISQNLEGKIYFANPHSPWERGLNENINGLIRQFFPKGTDFNKISVDEVLHVQHLINGRPRKTMGFRTPYQVLSGYINNKEKQGVALAT
jgi:transposase, IS30 family